MTSGNTDVANLLRAIQEFLGQNDMMAYLSMMAVRLIELHRVLKPTGSLYLHCDPTASHYLKLLLDGVFGARNFRSEIIWRRTNAHNKTRVQYGPIHDTILFYTKTSDFVFHPGTRPYTKAYIEDRFKHEDERGRYQLNYLTGPGTRNGESGQTWGGYDPKIGGRHWAIPDSVRDFLPARGAGMKSHQQLDILLEQGLVVFPKKAGGQPMYKQYVGAGVAYQDIWAFQPNTRGVLFESDENIDQDVKYLEGEDEKLGYDTQKPIGLLERIITSSSDENDVVLDPFCGCGTAVHAAQKLGRQWIGIDVTYLAIGLIERRLKEAFPGIEFEVIGEPVGRMDAEHLAETEPHQFQYWITQKIGGQPYQGGRKGADRGIDGYIYYTKNDTAAGKSSTAAAIISVKAGRNVGVAMVRDLKGVIEREKADIGIFVCVINPSREMEREAAAAGIWTDPVTKIDYPRLQLFTLAELFQGRQPRVPLLDRQAGFKRAAREDSREQGRLL